MPGRTAPLVTGEIYHVFNRGIDRRPTFVYKKSYERAQQCLQFYQFSPLPISFSVYLALSDEKKEIAMRAVGKERKIIDILSYCLMPNHFHLLIRQKKEGGISKYLSNFQNSCTRYFNTRQERVGPLFLDQFKAVRIEADEQLTHVSRYIHLNPYTSFVIKTIDELYTYRWSSFPEYIVTSNQANDICDKEPVLSHFKSIKEYKKFVFDQADYQRRLAGISHLTLEDQ